MSLRFVFGFCRTQDVIPEGNTFYLITQNLSGRLISISAFPIIRALAAMAFQRYLPDAAMPLS